MVRAAARPQHRSHIAQRHTDAHASRFRHRAPVRGPGGDGMGALRPHRPGEVNVLEAAGLAKRYRRGVWALAGIDLAIPAGGVTALVGPNAAGKSTLIKTWVGFEKPTRGSAAVMGIDPWRDRSRALANVGYVPQSPALYDGLSVEDHLDLAVQLRRGFDREAARARLDQLGIPRAAGARSLSGGQQAQVALALALGTRAPILLLDEPLASLDAARAERILGMIERIVARIAVPVVLVSHEPREVERLAGCVLALD